MLLWFALYSDGSYLPQYDGEKENRYQDIDRDKLVEFRLLQADATEDGQPLITEDRPPVLKFSLLLDPGQRLIYRRRVQIDQQTSETRVFYLVGWQQTIAGQNVQAISYIPECEECVGTVMGGKFREDIPLFMAIEPYDWERELGVTAGE